MPSLSSLIKNDLARGDSAKRIKQGATDVGKGIAATPANLVGGIPDLIGMALAPLVGDREWVGGSAWLKRKQGLSTTEGSTVQQLTELLAGGLDPAALAKGGGLMLAGIMAMPSVATPEDAAKFKLGAATFDNMQNDLWLATTLVSTNTLKDPDALERIIDKAMVPSNKNIPNPDFDPRRAEIFGPTEGNPPIIKDTSLVWKDADKNNLFRALVDEYKIGNINPDSPLTPFIEQQVKAFNNYKNLPGELEAEISRKMMERTRSAILRDSTQPADVMIDAIYGENPYKYLPKEP